MERVARRAAPLMACMLERTMWRLDPAREMAIRLRIDATTSSWARSYLFLGPSASCGRCARQDAVTFLAKEALRGCSACSIWRILRWWCSRLRKWLVGSRRSSWRTCCLKRLSTGTMPVTRVLIGEHSMAPRAICSRITRSTYQSHYQRLGRASRNSYSPGLCHRDP